MAVTQNSEIYTNKLEVFKTKLKTKFMQLLLAYQQNYQVHGDKALAYGDFWWSGTKYYNMKWKNYACTAQYNVEKREFYSRLEIFRENNL